MTKIICTIGPASKSESVLTQMIKEGMSVARINFSHGTYKEIKERVNTIRKVSKHLRKNILIFADLQGPKIRIGRFKNDKVFLTPNQKFIITTKELKGDKNKVSVDYKELPKFIKPKDKLFLDDGKIELVVEKVKDEDIICKVIEGGVLSSRKGLTVKEKFLPLEPITQEDKKDIEFALSLGINWFAQSFVRKKEDVLKLKEYLRSLDKNKKFFVIAKIEDAFGYKNIDGILEVADGVMVARGDLGVSVERALVPIIQKEIIEKTNKAKKLDIIATQMLETMVENPYPTRAEVNDVAVAVMQGAD
ncbi:MAG: pyruvate kinase, partial [Endomicrobia bacterium]|nr:pyruvate kinase [Endomicrobiia bacterium]